MASDRSGIWIFAIVLGCFVIAALVRLSGSQQRLQESQKFESQAREILDRTWPESDEGKLRHLQSLLERAPIAMTIPEQVERCRTYTNEAVPDQTISIE